jgi:hypothetical protein
MSEPRAIDVLLVALPDGTCFWSDEVSAEYAGRCMRAWKDGLAADRRATYETSGVLGGFVVLKMLPSDYRAIQATNQSCIAATHGQ